MHFFAPSSTLTVGVEQDLGGSKKWTLWGSLKTGFGNTDLITVFDIREIDISKESNWLPVLTCKTARLVDLLWLHQATLRIESLYHSPLSWIPLLYPSLLNWIRPSHCSSLWDSTIVLQPFVPEWCNCIIFPFWILPIYYSSVPGWFHPWLP